MNKQKMIREIKKVFGSTSSLWDKELKTLLDQYVQEEEKEVGWKPKRGEIYYVPNFSLNTSKIVKCLNDVEDKDYERGGLICKTPEEATQLSWRMLTVARNWKPEPGETYWFWDFFNSAPECTKYYDRNSLISSDVELGNCFPSITECQEWAEKCGWSK